MGLSGEIKAKKARVEQKWLWKQTCTKPYLKADSALHGILATHVQKILKTNKPQFNLKSEFEGVEVISQL